MGQKSDKMGQGSLSSARLFVFKAQTTSLAHDSASGSCSETILSSTRRLDSDLQTRSHKVSRYAQCAPFCRDAFSNTPGFGSVLTVHDTRRHVTSRPDDCFGQSSRVVTGMALGLHFLPAVIRRRTLQDADPEGGVAGVVGRVHNSGDDSVV